MFQPRRAYTLVGARFLGEAEESIEILIFEPLAQINRHRVANDKKKPIPNL